MGLREKAKYYKGGLRKKAQFIKTKLLNNQKQSYKKTSNVENDLDNTKSGLRKKATYFRQKLKKETEDANHITDVFYSNLDLNESSKKTIEQLNNKIEKLQRKIISMNTLFDVSEDIQISLSLSDILQSVALACMGQLDSENVNILILNEDFLELAYSTIESEYEHSNKQSYVKISEDDNLIKFLENNNTLLYADKIINELSKETVEKLTQNFYFNFMLPLTSDNELQGLLLFKSEYTENKNYSIYEDNMFLERLSSITGNAIKNIKQYSYLENILSFYNAFTQSLVTIFKYTKNSDNMILEKTIEILKEKLNVHSHTLFAKKDHNNFDVISVSGIFENITQKEKSKDFYAFIKDILTYGNKWLRKRDIEKDSLICEFFKKYNLDIPQGIILIPLVHKNIISGILILTQKGNISFDNFMGSPDFDYIIEIIGLLLTYHI